MLPLQVYDIVPYIEHRATGSLYLGTETLRGLKKAQLIKGTNGRWPYHLFGTLSRGEKLIKDSFVDILPIC